MKSKRIVHSRQQAHIHKAYYKPSWNPLRFGKAILAVLIFGTALVAHNHLPVKRKSLLK
jgi:hypothetical protein